MEFQILLITNDHLIIEDLIKNWYLQKKLIRVCILANGPHKELIKEKLKNYKKVVVILGEFIDFSTTRNELIRMCNTDKYYTLYADDSYFIDGQLIIDGKYKQYIIDVYSGPYIQKRRLLFKGKYYYSGAVHENLICDEPCGHLKNVFIKDVVYKHHIIRTNKRAEWDLMMLSNDNTRRGRYYKGTCYMKMGRYDKMNEIFSELLKEDKNDYYAGMIKKIISIIKK